MIFPTLLHVDYIETRDRLLHFASPKMRKSDQRFFVLLDIEVLIFYLKIGPHITLFGHNALLLEIALL